MDAESLCRAGDLGMSKPCLGPFDVFVQTLQLLGLFLRRNLLLFLQFS